MKTKTYISAIALMATLMACENSSTQTELMTIDVEKKDNGVVMLLKQK